jgi:hypothetical protein
MAMIIEQAGGKTMAGAGRRIMDIEPTAIHQRTPVILGAADQVDAVLAHLRASTLRPAPQGSVRRKPLRAHRTKLRHGLAALRRWRRVRIGDPIRG